MVDLQRRLGDIHRLNAEVVAVSASPNVPAMVERFNLHYPMLLDPDASVCTKYDAYDAQVQAMDPIIYVIDKEGFIRAKFKGQHSDVQPVIDALKELEPAV